MDRIHVGYVQGVHGLRGDLKVKCKFQEPDKVFINGKKIYLNEEEHTITGCKFYKGFYLTTIDNLKDINLVEKYKGYDVYIDRSELELKSDEYLIEDLKGMQIVELESGLSCGEVIDFIDNGMQKILLLDSEVVTMVPLVSEYVENVDAKKRIVTLKNIQKLGSSLK